jgi:hypothetical protein
MCLDGLLSNNKLDIGEDAIDTLRLCQQQHHHHVVPLTCLKSRTKLEAGISIVGCATLSHIFNNSIAFQVLQIYERADRKLQCTSAHLHQNINVAVGQVNDVIINVPQKQSHFRWRFRDL